MPDLYETGRLLNAQTDKINEYSKALRQERTESFIGENEELIGLVIENVATALGRFKGGAGEREKVAEEAAFLWIQARLAREDAVLLNDNMISGYYFAAAATSQVVDAKGERSSYYAVGVNRESDMVPIANVHAETSAIEGLRKVLNSLGLQDGKKYEIDMVVITDSPPCASCREEMWMYRSSDETLVVVIGDKGEVSISTIGELFPIKFEEVGMKQVPKKVLKSAKLAAVGSRPSRYQKKDVLPLYGFAMGLENSQIVSFGSLFGDDAFFSYTPTLNAIARYLELVQNRNYGIETFEDLERVEVEALGEISEVVYYYFNGVLPFYPSGKDRQHLTRLPERTKVFIVEGDTGKVFRTTVGELIPGAFVAQW